jgi:hypothetical protein
MVVLRRAESHIYVRKNVHGIFVRDFNRMFRTPLGVRGTRIYTGVFHIIIDMATWNYPDTTFKKKKIIY